MSDRRVKLAAGPGFHLPHLDDLDGAVAEAVPARRIESTYYDTADLRLARWGCSLRHRGGEGWTLSLAGRPTAAGVVERPEIDFPGPSRKPPAAALALLRAYLRHSPLQPVARLSTLRQRLKLAGPDGARLGEVMDEEVSVLDGRRVAARFREIEVKLTEAGEPLRQLLLDRLGAAGAAVSEEDVPKHIRAMGPQAAAPAEVAPASIPPTDARGLATQALAAALAQLLRYDPPVRQGGDPEDVKKARVAVRRLRSHLRTFGGLLDQEISEPLNEELGWLGGELGAVRDGEVLLERIRNTAKGLAGADRALVAGITQRLEAEIAGNRGRLIRALDSERYIVLVEALVALVAAPPFVAGDAVPPVEIVRPAWKKLKSGVADLGEDPEDAALHHVRILAKRCRYAAEAVVPVIGEEAAAFARALADVQTVLGDHQDAVTTSAWLRAHSGAGRRAFVAGELHQLERAAAADARLSFPPAWEILDKKPLRRWLTA